MVRAKKDEGREDKIRLRGVRQNNLKNVDCDVPLRELTVVTGVSGSGKSSFAFDTLYAEGQRRYIETFSTYTRQFLDRLERPEADSIEGIPPAIAIDQSGLVKTSRSTVGTLTGINDYLKLLYARASDAHCPSCDRKVEPEDTAAVLQALSNLPADDFPVLVVAPVPLGGVDDVDVVRETLRAQGYVRYLKPDGASVERLENLSSEEIDGVSIDVVVDRFSSASTSRKRRADSVALAFRASRGSVRIVSRTQDLRFTEAFRCADCGVDLLKPSAGLFSFNTPYGACADCRGFGRVIAVDWNRVVPDRKLSLAQGAIRPWQSGRRSGRKRLLKQACERAGISMTTPWEELSDEERHFVLEGGKHRWDGVRGFFNRLEEKKYKMHVRVLLSRYRGYFPCTTCNGTRLRPEALCFRVGGKTLPEFWGLAVRDGVELVESLRSRSLERPVRLIVDEVASRLQYLDSVGLGYLSLDRQSRTLSGGEVERVNLTAALGASLVDTLFVLDEPSIGLHARDNARLLKILRQVRDRGNTVVVVEHDLDILNEADHIIDIGPASGDCGGEIVAQGSVAEVCAAKRSLTGDYLSGRRSMPKPPPSEDLGAAVLEVRGARENNLQGVDVDLPLRGVCVLTGVSGSGKSSLLHDVVWRSFLWQNGQATEGEVKVDSVRGFDSVDDVVLVDQSPIGRTPRGNPATYTKTFDLIRKLFAQVPEAQELGLNASSFSFNVEGGRCPECSGAGAVQVEMQFLSDVTLTCEACQGKRFREEVLGVRLHGKNVDDVLGLTIDQATEFFDGQNALTQKLSFLSDLGLGYLKLGQPINTLSGGEAQRLKLAGRVMASKRGQLLFLLDEPTTGLHLDDVRNLIDVLRRLTALGHGMIIIEHHLDVIAAADSIVDLGPEGGDGGGQVVASGTPDDIVRSGSITGTWLKRHRSSRAKIAKKKTKKRPAREAKSVVRVVGARENNLKNVDVEVPRGEFVVVTGLSGAGKSSLVHDIIFSEGQRRYLDSLSPYARQFVEGLQRPDIDHLEGIPPAVAIEQRTTVGGRKSTVGTVTEIYPFLRLLFTRTGVQTCPDCDVEVVSRSYEAIRDRVHDMAGGGGRLLAPAIKGKKGFHSKVLSGARKLGVTEARIDGSWVDLPEDQEIRLARHTAHDIDFVVARFKGRRKKDLDDALRLGLELGSGVLRFVGEDGSETLLSRHRSCPICQRNFDAPDPRNFSFHSRHGWCPDCKGFGSRLEVDPEILIDRWDLAVDHHPRGPLAFLDEWPFKKGNRRKFLRELMTQPGVHDDGRSLADWTQRARKVFLEGRARGGFVGLMGLLERRLDGLEDDEREWFLTRYGKEVDCEACDGSRLAPEWSAVRIDGASIGELVKLNVESLRQRLKDTRWDPRLEMVTRPLAEEIDTRLRFLEEVGLPYVSLDRSAQTLSGGEAQRIRLAAQLGSNLRGACYILDEPTIGLHPRDNDRLLSTLCGLRDRGNSVIVIEHDDATIEAADHIIDMGPGPGRHGGEIVAQGRLDEIIDHPQSATAAYFRSIREQRFELSSRDLSKAKSLRVRGATRHNLQNIEARFPLGAVTVVTGVSGAGKSTLVREVLEESVRRSFRCLDGNPGGVRSVEGIDLLDGVREVDQLPIGRTPRSTPATYVGFWSRIRQIFASLPEARERGYEARRFSFNTGGGRCETCSGQGRIRMEMDFLPDVTVVCETCGGDRFNPETLEVSYAGRNVAEVLAMSIEEAEEFFSSYDELTRPLRAMNSLGLGYLTLGQASTTLSGGEAQRVKLAVELGKRSRGTWLYLFDEPTTGLHMQDVARLVEVLHRLAEDGHAVVVI
ncbi:MAG: excinuclease ABC subunit UvrA, partial [Planctomycetota bacterium]